MTFKRHGKSGYRHFVRAVYPHRDNDFGVTESRYGCLENRLFFKSVERSERFGIRRSRGDFFNVVIKRIRAERSVYVGHRDIRTFAFGNNRHSVFYYIGFSFFEKRNFGGVFCVVEFIRAFAFYFRARRFTVFFSR